MGKGPENSARGFRRADPKESDGLGFRAREGKDVGLNWGLGL